MTPQRIIVHFHHGDVARQGWSQQDANIYVAELEKDKQLYIDNHEGRQSYLLCLEGRVADQGIELFRSDALKLGGEERLTLTALENSHLLMVEMAAGNESLTAGM